MSYAHTTTLTWNEAGKIADLIRARKSDVRGLYVWTRENYVAYVGCSRNILERHFGHYLSYISGRYWLPKSDHVQSTDDANEWMPPYWKKAAPIEIFNVDGFKGVVERGFDRVESYRVFFSSCENDLAPIEGALIYDISRAQDRPLENERGKGSPPSTRVKIEHLNARWASESLRQTLDAQWHSFAD